MTIHDSFCHPDMLLESNVDLRSGADVSHVEGLLIADLDTGQLSINSCSPESELPSWPLGIQDDILAQLHHILDPGVADLDILPSLRKQGAESCAPHKRLFTSKTSYPRECLATTNFPNKTPTSNSQQLDSGSRAHCARCRGTFEMPRTLWPPSKLKIPCGQPNSICQAFKQSGMPAYTPVSLKVERVDQTRDNAIKRAFLSLLATCIAGFDVFTANDTSNSGATLHKSSTTKSAPGNFASANMSAACASLDLPMFLRFKRSHLAEVPTLVLEQLAGTVAFALFLQEHALSSNPYIWLDIPCMADDPLSDLQRSSSCAKHVEEAYTDNDIHIRIASGLDSNNMSVSRSGTVSSRLPWIYVPNGPLQRPLHSQLFLPMDIIQQSLGVGGGLATAIRAPWAELYKLQQAMLTQIFRCGTLDPRPPTSLLIVQAGGPHGVCLIGHMVNELLMQTCLHSVRTQAMYCLSCSIGFYWCQLRELF